MCLDSDLPPALSSGDVVAVIRIQSQEFGQTPRTSSNWRLCLSNSKSGPDDGTKVTFDTQPEWWRGPLNMRIQQVAVQPHNDGNANSRYLQRVRYFERPV
jgi:hypothetical protein